MGPPATTPCACPARSKLAPKGDLSAVKATLSRAGGEEPEPEDQD